MDVKKYFQDCQECQWYKRKSYEVAGKLHQTVVCKPWEKLGVDLMGSFPRSSTVGVDFYTHCSLGVAILLKES